MLSVRPFSSPLHISLLLFSSSLSLSLGFNISSYSLRLVHIILIFFLSSSSSSSHGRIVGLVLSFGQSVGLVGLGWVIDFFRFRGFISILSFLPSLEVGWRNGYGYGICFLLSTLFFSFPFPRSVFRASSPILTHFKMETVTADHIKKGLVVYYVSLQSLLLMPELYLLSELYWMLWSFGLPHFSPDVWFGLLRGSS
ncbi:hypothetical protein V8F20_006480 [Naviculisporaceae sp. PSN 640]